MYHCFNLFISLRADHCSELLESSIFYKLVLIAPLAEKVASKVDIRREEKRTPKNSLCVPEVYVLPLSHSMTKLSVPLSGSRPSCVPETVVCENGSVLVEVRDDAHKVTTLVDIQYSYLYLSHILIVPSVL